MLTVQNETTPPRDWDTFLATQPGATFCHQAGWGEVMGDTLGHECLYATARDQAGGLQGVLPLVRVRSALFGHFLVSMPFLNYGGPVGSRDARRSLTDWAVETAKKDRAKVLEFRWRTGAIAEAGADPDAPLEAHLDVPPDLELTLRKVTVLLPLPETSETLWEKGLRAKLRSQVRRPMKEGFETFIGRDQVDAFYEVFAHNMRDLGTPVLPKAMFQRLPDAFGDDVTFMTVRDNGRTIAAGCGFHFRGEFEITWASSLREYSRQAPNMLLYWRMMENAIERGDHCFNFGRCTPGGGTHRFKTQWGGQDEPLPWASWSREAGAASPNPDQGKYRVATSVWSRLPVPLTRVIGPPLARRIP